MRKLKHKIQCLWITTALCHTRSAPLRPCDRQLYITQGAIPLSSHYVDGFEAQILLIVHYIPNTPDLLLAAHSVNAQFIYAVCAQEFVFLKY